MARFPKQEAQIPALAELMVNGFKENLVIFPSPPVTWISLNLKKLFYYIKRDAALAAHAAAETANTDKEVALEALVAAMKSDLRYAENTVNFDDDKLKLIGWAGKKAKTPLAIPGQPRLLEAPKQGDGWLFLDWKQPADGGKPNAYTIQRRHRPDGPWADVATAILTETTLVAQPKQTELEYKVIAVNKAGTGPESNTVMVVL